jgi:hypothetical protein
MAKATTASRAPRGTKILAQAFFAAADEIPEARRGEVVKAALTAIRDELKGVREKAAAAKAKAKGMTFTVSMTTPSRKAVGRAKVAAKLANEAVLAPARTGKVSAKRKAKSAFVRNEAAAAETPVQP